MLEEAAFISLFLHIVHCYTIITSFGTTITLKTAHNSAPCISKENIWFTEFH